MATTYVQIGSTVTVGAGGVATITFSAIPATYTDLLLKISARNAGASLTGMYISFNGSSSGFSNKLVEGNGSAAASASLAQYIGVENSGSATANTFSNGEVYIPNYAGSTNKSFSTDNVSENNSTLAYASLNAGLWSSTAAITSISLNIAVGQNFAQYSTATLYGISNS
jgi:hypothetical protein